MALDSLPVLEVGKVRAHCTTCRGSGQCQTCGGASMVGYEDDDVRMCPDCLGGRCRACMGTGWAPSPRCGTTPAVST